MTIYDGYSNASPLFGEYCGEQIPPKLISSSNNMLLHFQTTGMGKRTGFKIEYHAFAFSCGGYSSNDNGILASPLYPNPYPTSDCIYLISLSNGKFVNISFLSMDILCLDHAPGSDFIEIKDGDSDESPIMGQFCGNIRDVPNSFVSTKSHLRIR